MKPTKIRVLVINAIAAAVIGYLIVALMIGAGFAVPVSGLNLVLTLPAIALLDLGLVLPIVRYKKNLADFLMGVSKSRPRRPEPFYAVRVLMISKASSLAGAWFFGWHVGVLVLQLTNHDVNEAVWREAFGALGSALLTIAAVFAERACRLPDDGDDAAGAKPADPKSVSGPASA